MAHQRLSVQTALAPLNEALHARLHDDDLLKLLAQLPQGKEMVQPHLSPRAKHSLAQKMRCLVQDILSEIEAVLTVPTRASHLLRLELIEGIAKVELQVGGTSESRSSPGSRDEMLTTAEAAQILGYSRPHVAMLVDHGRLPGADISVGGHRRIPRSTVLAYRDTQQRSGDADYKEAARKSGMYNIPEETYLQAMAGTPAKTSIAATKAAKKKTARRK